MQSSFPDLVYAALTKLTWCDVFPAGIQAAAPWLAMKHSARKVLPADELGWRQDRFENLMASILANVEHLYLVTNGRLEKPRFPKIRPIKIKGLWSQFCGNQEFFEVP